MNDIATRLTKYLFREDPEVEFRIATGTEINRKGFAKIHLFQNNEKV